MKVEVIWNRHFCNLHFMFSQVLTARARQQNCFWMCEGKKVAISYSFLQMHSSVTCTRKHYANPSKTWKYSSGCLIQQGFKSWEVTSDSLPDFYSPQIISPLRWFIRFILEILVAYTFCRFELQMLYILNWASLDHVVLQPEIFQHYSFWGRNWEDCVAYFKRNFCLSGLNFKHWCLNIENLVVVWFLWR